MEGVRVGHWRCSHVKRGLGGFLVHCFRQRGDRILYNQCPARGLGVRGRAVNRTRDSI